jgi:hypothetical protein
MQHASMQERELMTDVLMLAIVAAFFVLAGALVAGCDRILGPDASIGETETSVDDPRGAA